MYIFTVNPRQTFKKRNKNILLVALAKTGEVPQSVFQQPKITYVLHRMYIIITK